MNTETKIMISKIQQAAWKMEQSILLLRGMPGMDQYTDALVRIKDDLEEEMTELYSVEK